MDRLGTSVSLGRNFLFIFVELPSASTLEPVFWIVPSNEVADMLIEDITRYLDKHPKSRPATQLLAWGYRGLLPEMGERYRNKWELVSAVNQS